MTRGDQKLPSGEGCGRECVIEGVCIGCGIICRLHDPLVDDPHV